MLQLGVILQLMNSVFYQLLQVSQGFIEVHALAPDLTSIRKSTVCAHASKGHGRMYVRSRLAVRTRRITLGAIRTALSSVTHLLGPFAQSSLQSPEGGSPMSRGGESENR